MKTVAILGANGFVGYACSEHFSKNGYEVISLIRDNSSQIRNLDNFDHLVIKYKSLDDKGLIQEVASHNPDLLINAAWNGVSGKYRNELFQLEDNLNLTQKSINFCNDIGSKKWLGFGSQAEYGNKNRTVKEEDILTPTTKYGESKVKCLNESIEMCNKLGIEHKILYFQDKFKYAYDLSAIWKLHTGLPFVFACWVANKEIDEKFISQFNKALKFGVNNIEKAIKSAAATYSHCINPADYLNNKISYILDADKREGMALFLGKVKRY